MSTRIYISPLTGGADEEATGHFDRVSTLTHLLENYEAPAAPVIARPDYRELSTVDRAQFDERRRAHLIDGIVVKTPQLATLLKEVKRASLRADKPVGRTGVVLSGPPTAGKTTGAFHVMVEGMRRHALRYPDWKQLGHTPVVYAEVPPNCTAKSMMGRFLEALELPFVHRMTLEERTQLAVQHLVRARTTLIVVDEMQNLARDSKGHSEALQALKGMFNAVRATPLYVGINLESRLLTGDGLGAQFASRSAVVTLGKLGIDDDAEQRVWRSVILAFEKQLGLLNQPPESLPQLADYLWTRTRGSISALSRLLTDAALDLVEAGEPDNEVITKELLESIRLDLTSELELERANEIGLHTQKGRRRAA